jgi:hypothetical protein
MMYLYKVFDLWGCSRVSSTTPHSHDYTQNLMEEHEEVRQEVPHKKAQQGEQAQPQDG